MVRPCTGSLGTRQARSEASGTTASHESSFFGERAISLYQKNVVIVLGLVL